MVRKFVEAKENGTGTEVGTDSKNDAKKVEKQSSSTSSTSSIEARFRHLFGFSWADFRSWKAASTLMHAPRDPASLGIFRMLFGFAMVHDVFNERHMADLGNVWHDGRLCYFTLFDFVEPLPLNWMFIIHVFMAIGALCIGLGLFFNYAIWLHIIPYWYVFFLDKTTWNNHTYLFGLVSLMLSFTSANHCYSLDAIINPSLKNKHVPAWNYGLFKFQLIVVYFIAGLKKYFDMDWMQGWSMGKLAKHWVFAPFTAVIPVEVVNFFIVHVAGATLDLLGGWLLFFDKTRPIGIFFVQQFHLMNSQMFSIGMFPYVMLCTTPMFCYPDWPRRLSFRIQCLLYKVKALKEAPEEPEMPAAVFNERCIYDKETVKSEEKRIDFEEEKEKDEAAQKERKTEEDKDKKMDDKSDAGKVTEKKKLKEVKAKKKETSMILRSLPTNTHHIVTTLVFAWMAWQSFMPYSHFVTKGYNGWTEGLYGYSWDMMIKTWSTQHVRVSYKDLSTGEIGYLNPDAIAEGSGNRWSSHPDMVKQFAKCVQKKFAEFNVTSMKLYFDVWRSMTKRFQQRMFDPRADLIAADWSPFSAPSWVMPVLSDLSDWRGRLDEISKEKHDEADGNEDLMPNIVFAADFPGLYLENYINEGLDNTTVELLQGEIEIEFLGLDGDDGEPEEGEAPITVPHELSELAKSGKNITLTVPGQSVLLPHGEYHRVHTIGDKPSCYMFVYENTTDKAEYKKEIAISKNFEKMMNASKDEPVAEGGRNFSDAAVVAEFFGNELDADMVKDFTQRFQNITKLKEAEMARTMGGNVVLTYGIKAFDRIIYKFQKQAKRYGLSFWYAYLSVQSIWEGRSLEDVMKEEIEEEESASMEASDVKNDTTDGGSADSEEPKNDLDNPDDAKAIHDQPLGDDDFNANADKINDRTS